MECYTDCNKAYFPDLMCVKSSIQFQYNGIRYNNFYEFKRPDIKKGEQYLDKYN